MEPQCQALISLLGADKILLPESTGYNASLLSYFSPHASAVRPLCFVLPKIVEDVSAIVKSLISNSCKFAVRSGGHMWFPGASISPGGVTIDLRGLDSVDLSPDHATISVAIGATWDAVYAALDPLGRSVAGGRVANVGVGGLTLGGGLSYYSPRYGWTCNQAKSFEVVLADGSVVRASAEENADLWKGLRGGGNNFGIVTRVEFVTFEQGDIWAALTFNPTTVLDKQAGIYGKLMMSEDYDENASFLVGWVFSAHGTIALNQLFYTAPTGTETPSFYKEVLDLPAIPGYGSPPVVANMSTHAQNSVAFNAKQANRYLMATITFVPTEAMIRETYAAFTASTAAVKDVPGMRWIINLEPLPPHIYSRGAADSCLGLADRTKPLVVFLLCPAWSATDEDHDEQVDAAARALVADIEARAKKLGVYDPYVYMGYAAPWQDVIASYGEESVGKLKELRARVDPQEVFTRLVPGGFKIPV